MEEARDLNLAKRRGQGVEGEELGEGPAPKVPQ